MLDDPSELNYTSGEVAGPSGPYGKNQVALNDDTFFVYDDS